jgi:hypothetical protein
VSAKAGKSGVRVERALTWREERSPNPADAEALGKLLGERLKAENIAPAPLLVCVGRDRVILKEVRYPKVSPVEEPAIVRFQAVKELTDPAEEVAIDYVPLGEEAGQARAAVLVLRKEMLTAYKTVAREAGLKLQAITPRPFGIASVLRGVMGKSPATPAPEPADAAVAILTTTERWAEFCVIRGDRLVFARSLAPGASLAGELRRNLALYAGQSHQHPVRALYVAGGSDLPRLQETLAIPVHAFDPLTGVSETDVAAPVRGGFAGAAGLLYAQATPSGLPVNFAQPKEPRPEKNPNQKRYALAAAVAAAVFLLAVAAAAVHLQYLSHKQDNLQAQLDSLDSQLKSMADDDARYKAVEEWRRYEVSWLDELYDLTAVFPDPSRIRLKEFSADPQDKSKTHVANITLTGATDRTGDSLATRLVNDLSREPFYVVRKTEHKRNTSGDDRFFFPNEFRYGLEIKKRTPADYRRTLRVEPPRAEQPDFGAGMFDGGFGGFDNAAPQQGGQGRGRRGGR